MVRTEWLSKTSKYMGLDRDAVLRGVSQAERPSIRDSLTLLYNPRLTRSHLEYEVTRHFRYRAVLSVLFFDIDNFKRINDTYGHQVGDMVLQAIGAVVQETVRVVDIAGRYGGEEFLVLCPQTTLHGGAVLAERLRKAISEVRVPVGDEQIKATVSIGVAATNPNVREEAAQVLARADEALYTSKKSGKNKVTSEIVLTEQLQARLRKFESTVE
jgi:diguanylate cyclase (GGDEF)-like protein